MRRFGIVPRTAREQCQRDQSTGVTEAFQELPAPTGTAPYRLNAGDVKPGLSATQRVIHVIGDHGGVKDPTPQNAVAKAMIADAAGVDYCYSVGDVVYFNGARQEYPPQFQEPYADYNMPIFAIPGNHDGDPEEDGEASLAAFMRYFCDTTPQLLPEVAEYNRDTMTQPNCYWTLRDELVTIIGLYSNVPSGGAIQANQQAWLAAELEAAPSGVPLIVALHHPPYSCDAHHGGSEAMGKILDEAFRETDRWPDLVLSGHVHNYQRFDRQVQLPDGSAGRYECKVPYIVCGAGGYHNLHAMATDAAPGMEAVPGQVTLNAFDATQWGFLRLTITASTVAGEYVGVDKTGNVTANVDTFAFPVAAAA